MRGELEPDFNEHDFREIHPNPSIGESLDFGSSPIGNESKVRHPFENFEPLAKNFSRREKITERGEVDENSILFQQKMIKSLLSAEKSGEAEKFWQEYENLVSGYAKELSGEKDKKEARAYFSGLKRSVLGSVAGIKFFKERGFEVKFPTTKEDGWKKCDLIFEPDKNSGKKFGLAVQIKSRHLPAMSRKEVSEAASRLILADEEKLSGDARKDFKTLGKYCVTLSKEAKKSVFPVFVNMPVSRETRSGDTLQLVNQSGRIDENLEKTLKGKWEECEKQIAGVDKSA